MLQTIAGQWAPGTLLAQDLDIDLAQVSELCDRGRGYRVENVGDFGFTMEFLRDGEAQGGIQTFMYSRGRYFTFITDING